MTGETLLQGRQSIVGKFRRNAIQKIAFPIEKPNPKVNLWWFNFPYTFKGRVLEGKKGRKIRLILNEKQRITRLGLEPRMSGPKPDVLPLHHRAVSLLRGFLPKLRLIKNRGSVVFTLNVDQNMDWADFGLLLNLFDHREGKLFQLHGQIDTNDANRFWQI